MRSRPRSMVVSSALVVLVGCGQGQDPTAKSGTDGSTTSTEAPPADAPPADSTAGGLDPACIDDYHGNQAHAAALDLLLDTTDTAFIALGDGIAAEPPELGSDQLVVCNTAPSDFFTLTAECPGYLAIEARSLEGGVTELLLYDDSFAQSGEPVDGALGDWSGFFLKPVQRQLGEGTHVIEVRHGGGAPQRYGLTVVWLPQTPCPP